MILMSKFSSKLIFNRWLIAVLLSILSLFIVITRSYIIGININYDSIVYLSMAHNWTNGNGLLNPGGNYAYLQNPVTPILYSSLHKILGITIIDSAIIVNALSLSATIFVSTNWLFCILKTKLFAIIGSILICCSFILLNISYSIMTDTLFNLFVVLFLINALKLLEKEFSIMHKIFITAIFYAIVAVSIRWLGITLILLGIVLIFINYIRLNKLSYIFKCILFGIITVLPLLIISLINFQINSNPFPHLSKVININLYYDPFSYHIIDTLLLFIKLFIPIFYSTINNIISLIRSLNMLNYAFVCIDIILIISFIIFAYYIIKNIKNITRINNIYILLLSFIFLYIACTLIVLYFLWEGHYITHIRLMPIYIPAVVLLLIYLENIYIKKFINKKINILCKIISIMCVLIFILINILSNYEYYFNNNTLAYNNEYWKDSSLYNYASNKFYLDKYEYYSNIHPAIYYFSGDFNKQSYDIFVLERKLQNKVKNYEFKDKILLFIFNKYTNNVLEERNNLLLKDIEDKAYLKILSEDKYGTVYEVLKKDGIN